MNRRYRGMVAPKRKVDQKKVLKRVWNYMAQNNKLGLLIIALSVIVYSVVNIVNPLIIYHAIGDYINDVEVINLEAIFLIFLSLVALAVVGAIMNFLHQRLMAIVANKTTEKMRSDAFKKLQLLPIRYYDKNPHGVIMSTLTNDIEVVMMALLQSVPQFIISIVTVIGSGILMFLVSWRLSLIPIAILPLMVFATVFIAKKSYRLFLSQQEKIADLNGVTEETITGLKVVKLYNQEQNVIDKFKVKNNELKKVGFKAQVLSGFAWPITNFINNLSYALIVGIGAYLNISFGSAVASVQQIQGITTYSRQFIRPINNLAQLFNIISSAIAGADRVFELIDQESEYLNESKNELTDVSGKVEFKNVTFGYNEGQAVLKNISFKAEAGQMIAIVGPTGSGKTTIINLLTRYYDHTSGDILIDNQSIFDYSKKSLRKNVGVVLQHTYLFSGTILENIKYGKPDATLEEVIEAAKLAQVHDIIERLPKGYYSRVKEGGSNFSHGERQLISIARTILSNPTILVLDEATSSVDTRTEINIQKSMEYLMKGRTSFVIAHRLKTIVNADIILVIKDGEIIERGSHQELMNKPEGLYRELYTMQFGESENN
ncbi:MAG TPA: ABC transporter ATP-binding protein [Acholeplasmataceae bacterium]|jgi:ATP-binding cassette subfamily B multidrug efflux pump|nr:ABC transporter ATP-binding protein [Acholeplasmataceae bacterium]